MERNRRPPCVEEALSSMLWTPYERTPSVSSEDESSPSYKLNRIPRKFNLPNGLYPPSREKHLYPEPIRYSFPSYMPFVPKTFNAQSANELPSYDNIEKERQHHSLGTIASSGIYFIPPYGTSMVNSFTDDFLQYQVRFALIKAANQLAIIIHCL